MVEIDNTSVLDLLQELQKNKFWGSAKLSYQEGRIVHIELSQTFRQGRQEQKFIIVKNRPFLIKEESREG